MPSIDNYLSLSNSSPRSSITASLEIISNSLRFDITPSTRTQLIRALLDDLDNPGKGRLNSNDAAKAFLAIKALGRDPSGSEFLALPQNFMSLLTLSMSYKGDRDASLEALRCIANALLLVESSRQTFLKSPVNGGDFCLNALEKATTPDQIFVFARILFLSTAFSASYIAKFVDNDYNGRTLVEMISSKLDLLLSISLRTTSTGAVKDAMTDVLKFIYNMIYHYPKIAEENLPSQAAVEDKNKVLGDLWSPKLDGLLPILLRLFISLPSTSPNPVTAPLTHVLHVLIGIPISPALKTIWFPPPSADCNTTTSSISQTTHDHIHPDSCKKPSMLQTFSSGSNTLDNTLHHMDILMRSWGFFQESFNHFFADTTEPDDPKVRELVKKENINNNLDDTLTPLIILITRLCQADETSRARVRHWLVPDDLDRTSPLEQRSDMLGKCLRLLGSVYHPRLKDAIGGLLFAMADSDVSNLTGLVGYGNIAGFLFNKGIFSTPPPSSDSSASDLTKSLGDDINPITGTKFKPKSDLPEMTEEEKEQEVDKLLWLFDRLEKTGAIPAEQNPIRKAIQEGKATLGP